MGSRTDAFKLVSSLTLFRAAAQRLSDDDPAFEALDQICDSLLAQTAAQGFPPCTQTLAQLNG
jgi:uncharacterized protein (DUF1810 family)